MNKKDNLLNIIKHFGVNEQQRKFMEEVFELQEAIIIYEGFLARNSDILEPEIYYANKDLKDHIAEEIADVMVILEQFKLCYGISSEEITKTFWEKVDRTLEEIKSGKIKDVIMSSNDGRLLLKYIDYLEKKLGIEEEKKYDNI